MAKQAKPAPVKTGPDIDESGTYRALLSENIERKSGTLKRGGIFEVSGAFLLKNLDKVEAYEHC